MHVTRTYAPLPFRDLDPSRFEDLCLSILYRMRRWEKIENLGRLGKDDAIDISANELLENGKRNTWHFQCKRYEKLSVSQVKGIIKDYCRRNTERPEYYFILTACSVSKSVRDSLEREGQKNGFATVGIWSAAELEARLFADHHDLLFAFFGINMSGERDNCIGSIRRNIALKKRMHKDFTKPREYGENPMDRIENPWKAFIHSKVLIRSIYDKSYPEGNSLLEIPGTGYYKAEVFDWYHNGLMVHTHPYVVDAKVRYLKDDADEGSKDPADYEFEEERLTVVGRIPFENIIEYDIDGDEYYQYPHLFCDFVNETDPYEEILYYPEYGTPVRRDQVVEFLDKD